MMTWFSPHPPTINLTCCSDPCVGPTAFVLLVFPILHTCPQACPNPPKIVILIVQSFKRRQMTYCRESSQPNTLYFLLLLCSAFHSCRLFRRFSGLCLTLCCSYVFLCFDSFYDEHRISVRIVGHCSCNV